MTYPGSVTSFTTKTDGADDVLASHINAVQTDITAIETTLGTNPQGTAADVKTRLAAALSGAGLLQFATATTLTIATGSITVTQNWHRIDTEASASTDDLDTITAGSEAQVLILRTVNGARNVVIKHGTGNIYCAGAKDITLDNNYDLAVLVYDASLSFWIAFRGPVGRFGDASNYTDFENDGTLHMVGNAQVWDDLRVEPVAKTSGAKAPTFGTFRDGLLLYQFDDVALASEKEVYFNVQMPHDWLEGSDISPHVHWVPLVAGTAGQVVDWGLEYTVAKIGDAFGASTTIYASALTYGTITAQYSHCLTDLPDIVMTGKTISSILACRLFRHSSDASDTLTQTAGLLYCDFHYQIDTIGSRLEFTK